MKDSVQEKAYGKINLDLDVLGTREDGYHLVRMIMQTVDIYDTVIITKSEEAKSAEGGILVTTDAGDIPAGPDNLVWRVGDLMKRTYGLEDGLVISIEKRIPVAAGMAGGSTDAAAVFRGLRTMYELDVDDETLQQLALPLGADIPYCITGGTQLSEGIGEVLTPLSPAPFNYLLICKPDLYVSTGWVYKAFDSIPAEEVRHPDVDAMLQAIEENDLEKMCSVFGNVLEQKTGAEYPIIGELEEFFKEQGAVNSIMTGSGPTVFACFDDAHTAESAFRALFEKEEYKNFQKFMTRFIYDIHA